MGMQRPSRRRWLAALGVLGLLCAAGAGCQCCHPDLDLCNCDVPRELTKTTLPIYVIEPPDILLIDALRLVPLPPYHIEPLDALAVVVPNALPTSPINGVYTVDPDGTLNLGAGYGIIKVVGLTIDEAKTAIEKQLKEGAGLKMPEVSIYPAQIRGVQQIRGDHLVRPDGSVSLGAYGDVNVAGKTIAEAKAAVEAHLSQFLQKPEVSIDVFAYNSKVIYIIYDGGGYGQQIVRLPATGNDTVLDAVAQINGLSAVADKRNIWVARPGPACSPCDQILPVDWCAITQRARVETNYQLLPGDRLFVQAEPLVTIDTFLARLTSPMERIFGVTLLGNGTVRALNGKNNGGTSGTGF
jgi:polysaccharide export outer membrane protein